MWGKLMSLWLYCKKPKKYQPLVDQESNAEGSKVNEETKGIHNNGNATVVITTILEVLGFLMQLGILVAIPILLVQEFKENRVYQHMYLVVIILLPISLFILSFVWSGWAVKQKKVEMTSGKTKYGGDRLKTGRIAVNLYTILTYIPLATLYIL